MLVCIHQNVYEPLFSLFLAENEHILPNKHHKQPLILNWRSLGACRVRQCCQCLLVPTKSRHQKRSCTWQDGSTQIESKARGTSKGRGTRPWFWLHVCWDTLKIPKKGAENTKRSIWEPGLKSVGAHTHTHTHFITHDRFIAQHTRKTQRRLWV